MSNDKISKHKKSPGAGGGLGMDKISGSALSDPNYNTTAPNIQTQTPQAAGLYVVGDDYENLFSPLTEIQRTAINLHKMGWNVFPVPRPEDVRRRFEQTGEGSPTDKPPYILQPLFTSRLHRCGRECKPYHIPNRVKFEALFERSNLAVMAGRTSGGICVIDCDKNGDRVERELVKRSIPFWGYETGKGKNFIVQLPQEAANIPGGKGKIAGVEIWGHDRFCVLPPSVHHTGTLYRWLNIDPLEYPGKLETTTFEALEWLGVTPKSGQWDDPELFDLPAWVICLSKPNREILASTPTEGRRNTEITKPLYDLAANVQAGKISENDALELLYSIAERSGYSVKSIDSMWKSAIKKADLEPAATSKQGQGKGYQTYLKAVQFAHSYRWPGRTAQTDRAVFLACAERAKVEGDTFRASVREISELANITKTTAITALKRLRGDAKSPHVKPLLIGPIGASENGNRYKFNTLELPETEKYFDIEIGANLYHYKQLMYSGINSTPPKHDVFIKLGKVAMRCYEHLLIEPEHTFAAIARATKQNKASVSRAVKRLMVHDLVTYNPAEGLYYSDPVSDDKLERIAAALGTLGRSEKRKREHIAERETRANLQVAWAKSAWSRMLDW